MTGFCFLEPELTTKIEQETETETETQTETET
jgi:hypothetical protein